MQADRSFEESDAFGIDHQVSRRLSAPILQLDLLDPAALQHLREMIAEPNCIFVHMAPPCGTASRARLIQRSSTDPPILRTDRHPDGLPHLTGDLAARVHLGNPLLLKNVDEGRRALCSKKNGYGPKNGYGRKKSGSARENSHWACELSGQGASARASGPNMFSSPCVLSITLPVWKLV